MKKLFFVFVILICLITLTSCNSTGTKKMNPGTLETISCDIKDWEIDSATAAKMIEHRRHPGNMSNIIDYNDCVRNAIMKAHPGGQGVWVEARYKDDDDEIRYCKNWQIPNEPGGGRGKKGKVKDFRTMIFVVTVKPANAPDPTYYYAIAKICPPPYDGTCTTPTDTAK